MADEVGLGVLYRCGPMGAENTAYWIRFYTSKDFVLSASEMEELGVEPVRRYFCLPLDSAAQMAIAIDEHRGPESELIKKLDKIAA